MMMAVVEETLLVEPTETGTKETLDAFAAAIEQVLGEAFEDHEVALTAPADDARGPARRGRCGTATGPSGNGSTRRTNE